MGQEPKGTIYGTGTIFKVTFLQYTINGAGTMYYWSLLYYTAMTLYATATALLVYSTITVMLLYITMKYSNNEVTVQQHYSTTILHCNSNGRAVTVEQVCSVGLLY